MKECSSCKISKGYAEFPIDKSRINGHSPFCKDCKKIIRANYYLKHKNLEKQRAYYWQNRIQNRIKFNFSSMKASSKARHILFDLTLEEYYPLALLPCFYCGDDLPRFGGGLDRIDSNKGYILINVIPCCSYCNFGKNNQTQEDFLARCIRIADKHRSTRYLKDMTLNTPSNPNDATLH